MGKIKTILIIIVSIIAFLMMMGIIATVITGTDTPSATVSNPDRIVLDEDEWTYEDMLRNEEYYKDKIITIQGIITTTVEYEIGSEFGLGICHDTVKPTFDCEEYFWVYQDKQRFLEDDIVEIKGIFREISELKSAAGIRSYAPLLSAEEIILIQKESMNCEIIQQKMRDASNDKLIGQISNDPDFLESATEKLVKNQKLHDQYCK